MGNPVTWALGYSIGQLGSDAQLTPTVFGMGGVGGSFATQIPRQASRSH